MPLAHQKLILLSLVVLVFSPLTAFAATYTYENTVAGDLNNQVSCAAPDGGSNGTTVITNLVRTIQVTNSFIINDVNLGFRADHTWRGDIDLFLVSPAGTTVNLTVTNTASAPGSLDNFDLAFDDEAANSYIDSDNDNTASPNYAADRSGTPANPLSVFDGENANGTWEVRMCDKYPTQDNGQYLSSQLVFDGSPLADLAIAKTSSASTYTPGVELTYTLVVTNNGPENASGLTVSDNLPSGLTLTAPVTCAATGTASCGGSGSYGNAGDSSFSDTAASVAAGAGNSLTYTVTVLPSTNMSDY